MGNTTVTTNIKPLLSPFRPPQPIINDETSDSFGDFYDPTRFESAFRVDMTRPGDEKYVLSREALKTIKQACQKNLFNFDYTELECLVEKNDPFYDVKCFHFTKRLRKKFENNLGSRFSRLEGEYEKTHTTYYIHNKWMQQVYLIYMYCGEPSQVQPFHGSQMKLKKTVCEKGQGKREVVYEHVFF